MNRKQANQYIYRERERCRLMGDNDTHTHTHTHTDKMTMTNNNLQMTKIEILNSFIYLSIILFSSIIQPRKKKLLTTFKK